MPDTSVAKKAEAEFKRSLSKQVVLGFLTNFSSIAPSMSLGFSAVALPILKNALSESKLSWFASVASLATPFGCFLSGPVADRYGRKTAILLVNAVCFCGWLAIAASCYVKDIHYPLLILGRIFTGFSTGLCSSPATIYMAEVASPDLRGVFTVWPSMFFSIGVLVVYFLGLLLKDNLVLLSLLTCLLPSIGIVLSIFLVPESPSWLIGKNRINEAKTNMCTVFGSGTYNAHIQMEIEALISRKGVKINTEKKSMLRQISRKFQFLMQPYCLTPLMIILIFFFFQQASGIFVIIFYAINIVKSAGITIDSYLTIVIIAFVRLGATIFTSILCKRFGKRTLSIWSGASMGLCLFALVGYLHFKDQGMIISDNFNFLPFILLIIYFTAGSIGFLPFPFALSAEIFPTKIKGLASGLASGTGYLFSFVMVKFYLDMVNLISVKGVFCFYGIISFLGTIFVIFMLPETKGKSLQEIEEYFGKKPNADEEKIDESSEALKTIRLYK